VVAPIPIVWFGGASLELSRGALLLDPVGRPGDFGTKSHRITLKQMVISELRDDELLAPNLNT
jgi:hypothetical protein